MLTPMRRSGASETGSCERLLLALFFSLMGPVIGPADGLHPRRQAEPRIDRLLPDRVARRWEGRCVKRAHRDPADRRIAVPFPIERAAAIRAEMKSNAIAAVGVAFIDLPLAIEPHPFFRIRRAEVEGGAGAALALLAVA